MSFVNPKNRTKSLGDAVLTLMGATPADGDGGCGMAEGGAIFDAGGATSPADEEEEDGGRDVGDFGEGRVGKAIERSRSFNSF